MLSNQQESPEGKKMLDFRKSLPSFKEKDRLLQAIARNQVLCHCAWPTRQDKFIHYDFLKYDPKYYISISKIYLILRLVILVCMLCLVKIEETGVFLIAVLTVLP